MSNYRDYQSTSYNPIGESGEHNGDFNKLVQIVAQNIQKLTSHTSQLQSMVNKIGTAQDNEDLRNQLHHIQHYANQIAKETNQNLKELGLIPNPTNLSEQKQRRMQREKLATDFTDALKNFQINQRTSAQKEKESVIRARANSGLNNFPSLNNKGSNLIDLQTPEGTEEQSFVGASRNQQTQLQIEEEVNLSVLRDREQAIRKIESDIVGVNQIFKDLATMVHDQGTIIDSIEGNIESSSVQIQQGTQELHKASEYSRKARRKKFFLVFILLVVLAVIILIIHYS